MVNDKVIDFEKAQETLGFYKKKLEQAGDVKQKNWELTEMNKQLQLNIQRSSSVDADNSNVKQALAYFKEQLAQEKERTAQLTVKTETLEKITMEDKQTIENLKEKLQV